MHHPTLGPARLAAALALGVSTPLLAQDGVSSESPAPAASPRSVLEGYPDDAALTQRLRAMAGANASRVKLETLAKTREGRAIEALTLAGDLDAWRDRPAILIVAGMDGAQLGSTEIATSLAERLLAEHGAWLDEVTIHVVPRANPDAAAAFLSQPSLRSGLNARPVREDRDAAIDEDGPRDLDGDGVITTMRRANPPAGDPAQWIADPADPRLLKKPDSMKGDLAVYSLHVAGLDADGDGLVAEDGPGGVDPDRNFPHRWIEFANDAGPWPLSEEESLELAKFVIERPRIYAALVIGRHDNLVNLPDARPTEAGGRIPAQIDEADLPLLTEFAKAYKEATGQDRAIRSDDAGSLAAWLYHQRGILTFASTGWWRPDVADAAKPEGGEGDATASDAAPASESAAEAPPVAEPPRRGGRGGRGGGGFRGMAAAPRAPRAAATGPAVGDAEQAAWLAYSDQARGGAGFVDWTEIEHPTLGTVEVGGFVPGFMSIPPIDAVPSLAKGQATFLGEVVARRPKPRLLEPQVRTLAPGLFQIDLALVNDGRMPTATAMGVRDMTPPIVVRISTAKESIRSGVKQQSISSIGPGERRDLSWIVSAAPGEEIEIAAVGPLLPESTITIQDGAVVAARSQETGR
ncbi:MAG: M14 family metallopeptidase [Phycisphaerales bacterium]